MKSIFKRIGRFFAPHYSGQNRWAVVSQFFIEMGLCLLAFLFIFDNAEFKYGYVNRFWGLLFCTSLFVVFYCLKGKSKFAIPDGWWLFVPLFLLFLFIEYFGAKNTCECLYSCTLVCAVFFFYFTAINFFKRYRRIYVFGFIMAFAIVIAMFTGLFEQREIGFYAVSESVYAYYSAPMICGGILKSIGTLSFGLCAILPMCVAGIVSRRFSTERKILAIAIFGALWYGIFRCNCISILFCATVGLLGTVYMLSITKKEFAFYFIFFSLLVFGTWSAFFLDKYYMCKLTHTSMSALAFADYDKMSAAYKDFFASLSLFGDAAAKPVGIVFLDFTARYGVIAAILAIVPFAWLYVMTAIKFFKLPLAIDNHSNFIKNRAGVSHSIIAREAQSHTYLLSSYEGGILCVSAFLGASAGIFLFFFSDMALTYKTAAIWSFLAILMQVSVCSRNHKSNRVRVVFGVLNIAIMTMFLLQTIQNTILWQAYVRYESIQNQVEDK